MSQPLWAIPERQSQLVKFAMNYKGVCLEGHSLCSVVEHYTKVVTKSEAAWVRVTCPPRLLKRSPERISVEREELSDLYGQVESQAIDSWIAEDRDQRSDERRRASQHAPTGEVGRFGAFHQVGRRSSYDPVDIDNFVNDRPDYYLMGYGVNDQMRRFAKVRIPGTTVILEVDVSRSIQELGKNKRKKLRNKGFKLQWAEAIIRAAVEEWWGR